MKVKSPQMPESRAGALSVGEVISKRRWRGVFFRKRRLKKARWAGLVKRHWFGREKFDAKKALKQVKK